MKRLRISQMFSKLVVAKLLSTDSVHTRNFIAKFIKILDIIKEFAGNRVNELGKIPRPVVIPKIMDLEVITLAAMAQAYGIDSENYLFKRLESEKGQLLPNLITRPLYNQRRKLTARLGEEIRKEMARAMGGIEFVLSLYFKPVKVCPNVRTGRCTMGKDDCMILGDKGYLNAKVQQNLFDVANITLEVSYLFNQNNLRPPGWAYRKFRKRIETLFS